MGTLRSQLLYSNLFKLLLCQRVGMLKHCSSTVPISHTLALFCPMSGYCPFFSHCQRRVLGSRSLLVVYVLLLPNLREVPHGTKGTGPKFVTRPVYLRSQFRNNTNTVSSLVLLIHLLQVLCTRYAGIAHHRALQTSGGGWAGSKAVHGMECNGVRSLYWRSLSAGAAA